MNIDEEFIKYVKNSGFDVTVNFYRKRQKLSFIRLSDNFIKENFDKFEIINKISSDFGNFSYYDLVLKKNCYVIYNIVAENSDIFYDIIKII